MGQKEHIEQLIDSSIERAKRAISIQKDYVACVECFEDSLFTNLITTLETDTLPWVRKQLWGKGCYSVENEHAVLQAAREGVWKAVLKDSDTSNVRETFVSYAFGIYKKKSLDVIRKCTKKNNKMEIHLFSEPVGKTGKTQEDVLADMEIDPIEWEERRKMYGGIFYAYCVAFLTRKAFFPSNLALYYARVLPHLLGTIPDTKAASAKWAYERMGKRNVNQLKDNSEQFLQREVSTKLEWGNELLNQLNEFVEVNGKTLLLKDIIYTEEYDKGKIENWAEYMHKLVIKEAREIIHADSELSENVKDYVSPKDALYRFVKEGESR